MVSCVTMMEGSMKDNGFKIKGTVMDMNCWIIKVFIKVCIKEGKLMAKDYILGQMVSYMTVNGEMVLKTVMEFGEDFMVTHISDNGLTEKRQDTVYISGKIKINMRVNG